MVYMYNTKNYWAFGLCSSSGILKDIIFHKSHKISTLFTILLQGLCIFITIFIVHLPVISH
jgi:hypothetical protein